MEYTDGSIKFKVRRVGSALDEINTVLNTKQDKLTFDSTPTAGSSNPVTSDGIKKSMVPTGVVMPFAGDSTPDGFLLCNGQAVSRTTYANLFTFIGTKYGAGDGSTTFNVPNLVNRFVEGGSVSGETKEAGLPNITGEIGVDDGTMNELAGAFYRKGDYDYDALSTSGGGIIAGFDASRSSAVYGKSDTVQPASIIMMYIIKI